MARPIASDHGAKQGDILDRAAELFAQDGYASASMQGLAVACGLSKATLYHYYATKDALLFDLLDRYTQRLLALVAESEAAAQRKQLNDPATLHELIRQLLATYERAGPRHAVLLTDAKQLAPEQHALITQRQRDLVAAVTRLLTRAYPERATPEHATALTMMLFGMVNWTFTWLKPQGRMSYHAFAELVIATLESGLQGS